jgi:magnesium transporter
MIRVYRSGGSCDTVDVLHPDWRLAPDVLWLDLVNPTREEETVVERALELELPTPEEMAELEASSRLYRDRGALFLTTDLLHQGEADMPSIEPVTFVLTPGPLVTIRYFDPRPFTILADRLALDAGLAASAPQLLLNLLEAVIDRTSDVLSKKVAKVQTISRHVFSEGKTVGFARLITKLGHVHTANARIEQSLTGLARIVAYLGPDDRFEKDPELREHLRSLARDAASLIAHSQSLAASIDFQLSAALGLINIEQSSIIKIFSVAAVAFLPPTLIASIYGMNFDHMPELHQTWGYPAALVAMVVSAVLPLAWFRRQGWL